MLWISGDTVLYDGVREVADRLQVGTAVLHLGGVRFPVTGPVRYTMTAQDAVEVCRLVRPRTAIPVHYEGWSHFRRGPRRDRARARRRTGGRPALHPLGADRHRGRGRRVAASPVGDVGSTARDGGDDRQLATGCDRCRQAVEIPHVVGTDEQVDVHPRAAELVAHPALQRRVLDGEGVEHRPDRHRITVRIRLIRPRRPRRRRRPRPSVNRRRAPAGRSGHGLEPSRRQPTGAARTDTTGGRWSARTRHDSPSSIEP